MIPCACTSTLRRADGGPHAGTERGRARSHVFQTRVNRAIHRHKRQPTAAGVYCCREFILRSSGAEKLKGNKPLFIEDVAFRMYTKQNTSKCHIYVNASRSNTTHTHARTHVEQQPTAVDAHPCGRRRSRIMRDKKTNGTHTLYTFFFFLLLRTPLDFSARCFCLSSVWCARSALDLSRQKLSKKPHSFLHAHRKS